MGEPLTNGHQKEESLPAGIVVEEVEIPVPWGHVAGRWWGPRDKQPIIAIHGWQDNAGTWDNLIPQLPVTTSVLCIDLPGHGLSSHYPTGMLYYIFWDGVVLLRRIIKHFKWTENVTLMGHSLGGALSFMYAASYPDEVDRIICIDIASPAVRDPANMVEKTGWSMDKLLEYEHLTEDKIPSYDYDEMIDIVCDAYRGSVSKENCKVLMKRGMAPTPAHIKKKGYYFKRDPRLKVSGLAMMSIETALEYASHVKCKVLNIRALPGQKWERLDYYLDVIEKMKQTADVQFVEVEGTHHVHLEAPENILQLVEDFLEEY
ncbi:probable serine hydrolase [Ostrinia nubilalis]|uniref:probable serine hydrolase n=1 Tax=Ostrinia furnacalis TaxID=93504 RepID=UPI001038E908|nr:probable serine hydrolase [Ostrinia furnacalis]